MLRMLVFTIHVGIYDPCWYLNSCWYLELMLVITIHAGSYLRFMLVFTYLQFNTRAGIRGII